MAKDIEAGPTAQWSERGIRYLARDEIKKYFDEEKYEDGSDDEERTPDELDEEFMKMLMRRYPKSLIWMISGLFLGIGTGWLFSFIGGWGSLLAIGWLLKSIGDKNREREDRRNLWRI